MVTGEALLDSLDHGQFYRCSDSFFYSGAFGLDLGKTLIGCWAKFGILRKCRICAVCSCGRSGNAAI